MSKWTVNYDVYPCYTYKLPMIFVGLLVVAILNDSPMVNLSKNIQKPYSSLPRQTVVVRLLPSQV